MIIFLREKNLGFVFGPCFMVWFLAERKRELVALL